MHGKAMRIGIMGGTFDPIHLGHLRAAEEISLAFGLDRIIFVPAARPPHKAEGLGASPLHRYEMVSLATVFTPSFTVSPIELRRPGKSYSIETVREFFRIYGQDTILYFVLGVDAFLEIGSWKEARELLRLARLVVTARPGWRLDEVERSLTPGPRRLLGDPQFKYLRVGEIDAERLEREYQPGLVLLVEVVSLDISSSEIRRLVEQGRSVRFLVPDTVAAYIEKNRLYQPGPRARRRVGGGRGRGPGGLDGSQEAFEPLAP
jgi:nicotinate-nucleotide adenylyltransferase